MKVKLYITVCEHSKDGFRVVTDEAFSSGYLDSLPDYRMVGEADLDISEHGEWLASSAEEKIAQLESDARLELARKLSSLADLKAKFLSLGFDNDQS